VGLPPPTITGILYKGIAGGCHPKTASKTIHQILLPWLSTPTPMGAAYSYQLRGRYFDFETISLRRGFTLFRYSCQHFHLGYLISYLEKIKSKISPTFCYPTKNKSKLALVNADKVSVYCLDPLYFRRYLSMYI